MTMPHRWRSLAASAFAALLCLARPAVSETGDDLVTPIRVGRPDAKVVLSLWAQQEYSHLAARPEVAALFQDILREWAIAHPDVRLDVSTMPALEMHKSKLLMAAASDRLPDVASIDSFWMPLFLDGGHVKPLDPFWPAADRDDFLPFTIDTLRDQAGHVYGMWHGTDCRVLYYRKDLVPNPPRTWDELIAVASRISREKKISGYLYNAGRWEARGVRPPAHVLGTGRGTRRRRGRARSSVCLRIATRWSASSSSCATPSRAAPRLARFSRTTTISSSPPPRSRATSPCSWAEAGSCGNSSPASRRRSSPSGTSHPFPSARPVSCPPGREAGSG